MRACWKRCATHWSSGCAPSARRSAAALTSPTCSTRAAAARVLPNEDRALFGNHHGRCGGVARCDRRHDGGVNDAQPFEAEDAQPVIDHGERVARAPHLCGADGMENGRADIPGSLDQARLIVADRIAREIFLRMI